MYQGKPFSLFVTISSYTYPMLPFRFLRHEWKSESISVPPGHRVILSQFVLSSIGCDKGTINVFDSLYPTVNDETETIIAWLVFLHQQILQLI